MGSLFTAVDAGVRRQAAVVVVDLWSRVSGTRRHLVCRCSLEVRHFTGEMLTVGVLISDKTNGPGEGGSASGLVGRAGPPCSSMSCGLLREHEGAS